MKVNNLRDRAVDRIVSHLELELKNARCKIFRNRYDLKKFVEEYADLKKKRVELIIITNEIKLVPYLELELKNVRYKIFKNRYDFKKLVEEQSILKRECAELIALINEIRKTGPISVNKKSKEKVDG